MNKLLVDGSYLAYRSAFAPFKLTTSTGLDSTLIHAFLTSLYKIRLNTTIIAWESHRSWRRDLLPSYKPQKEKIKLNPDLFKIIRLLGFKQYYSPGNEADDVIATLSNKPCDIFTVDKDIMQLIDDRIPVRVLCKGKIFTEQSVVDKFGIRPNQIPDFLALTGDASDNIQGIPRIGPKTAAKLLQKYKTIDFIPLSSEHLATAKFNYKLIKLNRSAPLIEADFPVDETLDHFIDKYELKKIGKLIKSNPLPRLVDGDQE